MGPKLVVCPNCGAYVMSSDNICPRCDYPLNTPAPDAVMVADVEISPEDTPTNGATGPLQIVTPDLDGVETDLDLIEDDLNVDEADINEVETGEYEEVDRSMLPTTELPAVVETAPDELDLEEERGETLIVGAQIDEPALDDQDLDIPLELDLELDDEPTPAHIAVDPPVVEPPVGIEPPLFMDDRTEPNLGWVIPPEQSGFSGTEQEAESESDDLPPIQDESKPFWTLPKKVLPYEEPTLTQLPLGGEEDDSVTQARILSEADEPYIVPPAPYSPPPEEEEEPYIAPPAVSPPSFVQAPLSAYTPPSPVPTYTPSPAYYSPQAVAPAYGYGAAPLLGTRIQSYINGGYRLRSQNPRQAVLSYGKRLGVGTWIVALISIVGVLWYGLLMMLSGFRQDRAYLDVASDGRLYEEGPGAAHIRASRARSGRRWSLLGMVLFLLSLVLLIGLIVTAVLMLSQDRYQAALRKAYPEVTYFENNFSDEEATQGDIDLMKNGAVAYSILAGIAVVGVWGGFTLWVIGQVHASAYRVYVPPLPGYE